eukprot:CAMPEP_0176078448 /NCGR_PEP_ID=MMETSP0120_2-20121206/39230_1 /TAXON_ID=160619 /ORGANISM="Kryptoperidinium foliaceum, Strain CCMP 1326" /LENGTH=304 /DNA_ID=CAMNT_0017412193 /DNA_START=111 /DNA_END=1021 /DNA_ORIENTATION=+
MEGYGSTTGGVRQKQVRALGLTPTDLAKALGCALVPPLVFMVSSVCLCFRFRFKYPRGAWFAAALFLAPAVFAGYATSRARRSGLDGRWQKLATILLVVASLAAFVVGDLIYWYFSQPFYLLESLRAYEDVDPADVDGVRLMDAGRVQFSEGSRLALDFAMSYTSWDIYCVAPITTSEGLPSQGSQLGTYDLWAVGVNCCKSAETHFRCGEYDNPKARSGLRQVSAEQRPYLHLAVQQAEAAYNIQANHPLFFYWVEDPLHEEHLFFDAAFSNWILSNSVHFVGNSFAILAFVVMFNRASKSTT